MPAQFVKTADLYLHEPLACEFSTGNNGGDALVFTVAAYYNDTQSAPSLPNTLTDGNDNNYDLIMQGALQVYTGSVGYGIYLCKQCVAAPVTKIEVPAVVSSYVTDVSAMFNEYANATPFLKVTGAGDADTIPLGGTLTVPSAVGDLIIGIGYVASGEYNFQSPFNTRVHQVQDIFWDNTFQLGGDMLATGTQTEVTWASSPGYGSMCAAISIGGGGWSNGPGPSGESAYKRLIGGPRYTFQCLPEGRKIACVAYDCTNMSLVPGTFAFDELSDSVTVPPSIVGYIEDEIDLAQFKAGIGLSEVRTLIAYSKPLYNADDFDQSPGAALPALITNKLSGQSVILGAQAIALGKSAAVEHLVTSFVADCGHSLKVRFLVPQLAPNPIGRYKLLFCNWDQPQGITIAGAF